MQPERLKQGAYEKDLGAVVAQSQSPVSRLLKSVLVCCATSRTSAIVFGYKPPHLATHRDFFGPPTGAVAEAKTVESGCRGR